MSSGAPAARVAPPAGPRRGPPTPTRSLPAPRATATVWRPYRVVRSSTCSTNVARAQPVSTHLNRRTAQHDPHRLPADGEVGQAPLIPGVHPPRDRPTVRARRLARAGARPDLDHTGDPQHLLDHHRRQMRQQHVTPIALARRSSWPTPHSVSTATRATSVTEFVTEPGKSPHWWPVVGPRWWPGRSPHPLLVVSMPGTRGLGGDGDGANRHRHRPGSSIEVCEGANGHHFRLSGGRDVSWCRRVVRHHAQDRQAGRGTRRGRRRAAAAGAAAPQLRRGAPSWSPSGWRSRGGRISAKRLLPIARAAGYEGSARNFRRLVAEQKALWRKDHHRGRRPAVWSPGEYLVIDWAEPAPGLFVFCAVLAFSRWRFVAVRRR